MQGLTPANPCVASVCELSAGLLLLAPANRQSRPLPRRCALVRRFPRASHAPCRGGVCLQASCAAALAACSVWRHIMRSCGGKNDCIWAFQHASPGDSAMSAVLAWGVNQDVLFSVLFCSLSSPSPGVGAAAHRAEDERDAARRRSMGTSANRVTHFGPRTHGLPASCPESVKRGRNRNCTTRVKDGSRTGRGDVNQRPRNNDNCGRRERARQWP